MVYLFHSTQNNQRVFLYVVYVVGGLVFRSRLPLGKDLPDFLTLRRVGTPPITLLLTLFISQHRLETATMQIELDHIGRGEAASGQGSEKELIDALIAGHANRAAGGLMGSNNQARAMRISGDRHLPTIKQVPAGATFRMGELLIGGQGEALLDLSQVQQGRVFAAHHEADSC